MSYTLSKITRDQHVEIGQLLLHAELGVARFVGVRIVDSFAGFRSEAAPRAMLLLEFAEARLRQVDLNDLPKIQLIHMVDKGVNPPAVDILDQAPTAWSAFLRTVRVQNDAPPRMVRTDTKPVRRTLAERVRREVWRRDQGRCTKCGSRNRLEYDHIIPVAKGGSDTTRNIELLCETCNRKKGCVI